MIERDERKMSDERFRSLSRRIERAEQLLALVHRSLWESDPYDQRTIDIQTRVSQLRGRIGLRNQNLRAERTVK